MRRPSFILLALAIVLLNACGRSFLTTPTAQMSETDAIDHLQTLPYTQERAAIGGKNVSVEGLNQVLQDLAASGQLQAPKGIRNATTGGLDLTQLNNIFALLQSGKANSLFGLASGLVNLNGGNATGTKFNLDSIMQLINMALPIIMMIAPQYAPIIQALVTILPLVMAFISMFKKPKAALELMPCWA